MPHSYSIFLVNNKIKVQMYWDTERSEQSVSSPFNVKNDVENLVKLSRKK